MSLLTEFGEDIWLADGPAITAMGGFHYPTRMTLLRLAKDGLVILSPVALNARLKVAVDQLGPVRHLIAPNSLHHVHLPAWKAAYPEATLYAAPGVQQKHPDLAIDHALDGNAPTAWADEIEYQLVHGNAITSEAVFYHRKNRTVIFTDLLQQLPEDWFSGWRATVAQLDLMTEAAPTVPRKFRLAFTDRQAARNSISSILAWPADKVLMAHGTPVTEAGQAFLKQAFRWLMK